MRAIMTVVCSLFLLAAISGCEDEDNGIRPYDGGPCAYVEVEGVATVISVRDAHPDDYNCQDAVTVVFDFAPDDTTAVAEYLFPAWPDTSNHLRVGAGMNPPRAWVSDQGIAEGTTHRCMRNEIVDGTCTPVLFSFPDIDFSGWADACFGN